LCGVDDQNYLFGHVHGELLVRDAFGQRAFFLARIRIQMIMNPSQDALLTSNNQVAILTRAMPAASQPEKY